MGSHDTAADASAATPTGDLRRTAPPASATRSCPQCGSPFAPRRSHQKFCCRTCWSAFHEARPAGLRGVVSKVSITRRGYVTVLVRFGIEDRQAASQLTPGDLVEIVRS